MPESTLPYRIGRWNEPTYICRNCGEGQNSKFEKCPNCGFEGLQLKEKVAKK